MCKTNTCFRPSCNKKRQCKGKGCETMSVQFIRGTAVADLEAPLIQATKQWLEEDAQHEVFYLVPNHIKFEQEIQVLQKLRQLQTTTSDSITSTRLQVLVLSFGLVLFTTYTFLLGRCFI